MMDYNTTRLVNCEVCGKGFSDDCGDVFCSSSCECRYEREHMPCESCYEEVGEDNLNEAGICENCLDVEEEEENE